MPKACTPAQVFRSFVASTFSLKTFAGRLKICSYPIPDNNLFEKHEHQLDLLYLTGIRHLKRIFNIFFTVSADRYVEP
jgi:hypothetical protein